MEVIVLTLKNTPDRTWFCRGALEAKKVPHDSITLWYGQDRRDYTSTLDVCEAAAADGFALFKWLALQMREVPFTINTGIACVTWGQMQVLRHIRDNLSEPAIFILNDVILSEDLAYYEKTVAQLKDFKMLVLTHWAGAVIDEQLVMGDKYRPTERPGVEGCPEVIPGLYGGSDTAQVVSPAGAAWLLDLMDNPDNHGLWSDFRMEMFMLQLTLENDPHPGCYTIRPDNIHTHGAWIMDTAVLPSLIHDENFNFLEEDV